VIGKFEVRYTESARGDLLRLFDFMLQRAQTSEDFDAAQLALDGIRASVETHLSKSPFIYRKVGVSPFVRELIIPFRSGGYVALYEIAEPGIVNVLAVRHQLADDYY
jgi:plasmid stabilization system protein ParE